MIRLLSLQSTPIFLRTSKRFVHFNLLKAFSKSTKQTNSSSSNSRLHTGISLLILHLSSHILFWIQTVFFVKYLAFFSSLLPRSLNIIFDACAIILIFLWSVHSEAFIFFAIVTIVAFVKASGHFPVSYILLHTSTRHFFPLSYKTFNNYAGIPSHHSVFPLLYLNGSELS